MFLNAHVKHILQVSSRLSFRLSSEKGLRIIDPGLGYEGAMHAVKVLVSCDCQGKLC